MVEVTFDRFAQTGFVAKYMNIDSLAFPCLCIHKQTIFTVRNSESMSTTSVAALRGGLFDKLKIVDSSGKEFVVVAAKKLHGVGPFWGFNIFLNQRIRVAIEVEFTGKAYSADEVRQLVLKDFRTWHGWESREDFEQLKESVLRASSTSEIMRLVTT